MYEHNTKYILHVIFSEFTEMMEMDSPFHQQSGASIDGKNLNVLKRGQTVTFTCRVTEIDVESGSKSIDWLKDGKPVSLQVMCAFLFTLFSILIKKE
jgi:hypothetical protein